ncbi:MAG: type III pantothenate kinase [Nitrospinota bacterium]|nr:type III pantothenate kinase [Nitrospinota bacterium]MDH5679023.1 type III pantothenate kinase [Nitrospinota bacterium]MDH5755607.1 type III pantothenate kinase [Nitrospinota bacterium]
MGSDLLVVDIGNTHVVMGVYRGREFLADWRIHTKTRRTEDELAITIKELFRLEQMEFSSIGAAAISCVVPPLLPDFVHFCKRFFGVQPLVVGPGVRTGISVKVDDPREVGADRITNAAGAISLYKPPLIIVDFGTAITFDVVSAQNEYLGGAIAPGMSMSLAALSVNTAMLPRVELAKPPSVIGSNTINSMQSGMFYGFVSMVDGIVRKIKPLLGEEVTVIATGGEARLVAEASETINKLESRLTLEGLRVIHENTRKGR